jgi:hypothetical protein
MLFIQGNWLHKGELVQLAQGVVRRNTLSRELQGVGAGGAVSPTGASPLQLNCMSPHL